MFYLDKDYKIGELNLLDICAEYETPLFVYDSARLIQQYHTLDDALGISNKRIHFACKANSNLAILHILKNLGAGLDAVSIQEVSIGLEAGFQPQDIIFTPNSVSHEEMDLAIEKGVHINVDNIETLEYIGHHHPDQPLGIRINPHVMAGGHRKISVGHIDSKFGISIHQLPLVKRIVDTLNIKVEGLHMHTGSDILDVDVFLYAAEILFNTAREFDSLKYLDFGSGFKVKYKKDDIETDVQSFGERITRRFVEFCSENGKDLKLIFEPGKYLVSEAGYFIVKTNLVKQSTSTVFACVDSGFNHFIRPMFYNAYHEIVNISNPGGLPKIYSVVGYICETDTFAYNRKISQVRQGDLLCFKNAGAYCFSMASNYNGRLRPAEVLVHEGEHHLIRKRETIPDLLRNQVDPFK